MDVSQSPGVVSRQALTIDQRKAVANSADQKLLDLYSWAAAVQAREIRLRRATSQSAADPPIGAKVITFSSDEFNSFIQNFEKAGSSRLRGQISPYFSDGRMILQDGHLILAGRSDELGTVVGAAFSPSVDQGGKLHFELDGLTAGLLPVPQSTLATPMAQLKNALQNRLAALQDLADIDQKMTANPPAWHAVLTRLLLDSLNHRPSEPIICIPFDVTDVRRQIPVHVASIKVDSDTITARLEPIPGSDRPRILDQITQPYDSHP